MSQFYASLGLSFVLMIPEPTVFALVIAVAVSFAVWALQFLVGLRAPAAVETLPAEPVLAVNG